MSETSRVDVPGPDIQCVECGEKLPTTIHCTVNPPDGDSDGEAVAEFDLTEVWSHNWAKHP